MFFRPGVLLPESSESTSPLCLQEGDRQEDRGLLGLDGTSGLRCPILAPCCGTSWSVMSGRAQVSIVVPRTGARGRAPWGTGRCPETGTGACPSAVGTGCGPETGTGECPSAVTPAVHRRACRRERGTSAVGTLSLRLSWAVVAVIMTGVSPAGRAGWALDPSHIWVGGPSAVLRRLVGPKELHRLRLPCRFPRLPRCCRGLAVGVCWKEEHWICRCRVACRVAKR